ncbi:hypothetical protein [Granulicella sp. S190]|nr:hypothetical protein [Granulicella sp. S190]
MSESLTGKKFTVPVAKKVVRGEMVVLIGVFAFSGCFVVVK